MTRSDAKTIFDTVRENEALLESCPGPHDFSEIARSIGALVTDYRCTLCRGHVSGHDKRWYEIGLKHGRRG